MVEQRPSPLVVPPDEIVRQATAALSGYGYQLYQTVSAWISLKPNELLHVEFAEDFAVSTADALKLTQVKRTKAILTLRSKAVAALIRAVWTFQNANPGRAVVAALITTGHIGKERGLIFPDKQPGLVHWRAAAREHADIEPLRTALLTLNLPDDLRAFLRDASGDDIRRRIVRPIRWLASGPSHDEIERDLQERLVYFGQARGVGARDSQNALSALVVEVLACARRPPALRYVTAADLATVFEKNTYRLVPPSALEGGVASPGVPANLTEAALAIYDANVMPLPPRAALRLDVVESLHHELVTNGTLWLHGSSGLGKTTLALLLARHQNTSWTFADLRDLKPNALRLALARFSTTFSASGARGLILDDLPANPDNATILAVRRVARAVGDVDGVLIVTSVKPPPPTLVNGLDLKKNAIRSVPYLTENDIGQMVSQAGGNPREWARVIYLFGGGGHPQLVDARIMGLRQRGWPSGEQFADLLPAQNKAGDLEQERQSVRARLLRELDVDSRELLLRLSLLTNNFEREIVFAIGGVKPPLAQSGLVFDALVGPWIEQVGPERYRLSPLLRDSGEAGLTDTLRTGVRMAVVEHLIGRSPFPADQMMQLFVHAYALKHVAALQWFSAALVHTASRDRDLFKRLAEGVSVFALGDRGDNQLFFPENARVSAMLRYAQLRVAIATGDSRCAAKVLDRLLWEIDQLSGQARTNLLTLTLATALVERSVPIKPKRWLAMLKTLTALPGVARTIKQRPSHTDPFSGLTVSASHEEMLFVIRATALSGIDALSELIDELNLESAEVRNRYLSVASKLARSISHIVSSAWLSDVRTKGFDGKAAAAKFVRMREIAGSWDSSDMAVELACAQAVMLDEYGDDKQGALEVLAAAQVRYPHDYRINRQRQKVFYRSGEHALALAEFEAFSNAFDIAEPVERAFSLREAGRSAAEIGDLDKARLFFEQAWEATNKCSDAMRPMTAGLSADCAILDFQAGKIDNALALMLRALIEAEPIDPNAGLKEHYCILILVAAILWMRGGAVDWPVERQAMIIGMCSNPDPLPEIKDRPLPQRLLHWYELAQLEADRSDSQIVLAALRQRTIKGGLVPMETMLASSQMNAAVRAISIDRFLEVLKTYPRAVVTGSAIMRDPNNDVLNMPLGLLKPIEPSEWSNTDIREAVTSAVLIFALTAVFSGQSDVFDTFRARLLQMDGLGPSLVPVFDTIAAPSEKHDDLIVAAASVLGLVLQPNFVFDAGEAFAATVYLVQLLQGHVLGETAAGPVVRYFTDVWRDILANRSFSVRNLAAAGPSIMAATSKEESDRAKLAHLVLASETAVRHCLSDELRAKIRAITEPKRMPLADLQRDLPRAIGSKK